MKILKVPVGELNIVMVTLLFQVKTENPPLLFCLLISSFLSSVSIKPTTTMLVFFAVCVCVCGWGVCGCVGVCGSGMLICFVSTLGSHEMGRHKLPIIIIIINRDIPTS